MVGGSRVACCGHGSLVNRGLMADRVLPSRDIATQINKAFDVRGLAADRAGQAMQIVEAYASGRLVDRETTDLYERNPECITSGYGHHHTVSDHVDAGSCFRLIGAVDWLEETSR